MSSIIFTDQHDAKGHTIRFNVDETTREAASRVQDAIEGAGMLEIDNEKGGDPIFVNPERVASIAPQEED